MTIFLIVSAFLYIIYHIVLFFEDRRQIKALASFRQSARWLVMASSEELRTRAVEAIERELLALSETTTHFTDAMARDMVAAAEPFIRKLVVGEVVVWLRKEDDGRLTDWPYYAAEAITAEFGGSR